MMFDFLYKSAMFIGHEFDRYMILNGANFSEWSIGTSNTEMNDYCLEALSEEEAERVVEFVLQMRKLKIDENSSRGKFVYLKRILKD